jgi:predicted lipoprotein with Yx(FWY)xxD motif
MNRAKSSFGLVAVAIAALVGIVLATSSGSARTARAAVAPASSVSVKQTPLGKTLVDANGRALYLFAADKRDQSVLSSAGQAVWPPLTSATKPAAGGDVTASQIALIKSASGGSQVAYNGHPLYHYVGDHAPGQTNGQGLNQFGALWYVLSPAGQAITTAPTTPAPSSTGSSGNGYGY